jgi:hypothetical protein
LLLSTIAILATWAVPSAAGAQGPGIFDDFDAPRINATRWAGFETDAFSTFGFSNLESVRRVADGQLHLALSTVGPALQDLGFNGWAIQGLRLAHPAILDDIPRITVFRSLVTITQASAPACDDQVGAVSAAVFGAFFHQDGGGTPGSHMNDISLIVRFQRQSNGSDVITAALGRCLNPICSSSSGILSRSFARSWRRNVPELVTIRWQRSRDRFAVTVNDGEQAETQTLEYDGVLPEDEPRPRRVGRGFHVETSTPTCPTGRSRTSIEARIDRVQFNQSAIDALP